MQSELLVGAFLSALKIHRYRQRGIGTSKLIILYAFEIIRTITIPSWFGELVNLETIIKSKMHKLNST